MTKINISYNRRSFIKASALAGGGMILSFNWLAGCKPSEQQNMLAMPDEWFDFNSYLKMGDNGVVTIFCPNPEFGQGVKTSMPMIVAEELDCDWEKVVVEMADFLPDMFERQFTGGSQSIRQGWKSLRMAGASAKQMLKQAAATQWTVPIEEIVTKEGMLYHSSSGKSAHYGEMASIAATMQVPEEVELKETVDFTLIGTNRLNVDGQDIVTGKPIFGSDYFREGMCIAMIAQPPSFGLKLKSYDATTAKAMPGIKDVFTVKSFNDDYVKAGFDVAAFTDLVAIVGNSTWEVMQAKKALRIEWEPVEDRFEKVSGWRGPQEKFIPGGLESSTDHYKKMEEFSSSKAKVVRRDGDPEAQFKRASKIIERTYTAPFLAHNTMEPANTFAHVTKDRAEIIGPIQIPSFVETPLAEMLGMDKDKIDIKLPRMGGGFGRRAYGHYMIEAALISQKAGVPIKLQYSREDDMTNGIYRPTYHAKYRAAFDEHNNLIAFHVNAGGVPESPLHANRFPAGAIDHYLAEEWAIDSNITIGAFRAPRSNFISGAEQSFLDEVAEELGKDPIAFRLELLEKAQNDPVGDDNDYDAERYAGVLELVKQKSDWENGPQNGVYRGVAAYFCHNSYAAHVLEMKMENGKPVIPKVTCAMDCGIVINPGAASNMAEGAIIDGIGNALYGQLSFSNGKPDQTNFNAYRMIRMQEAPKDIRVHFVDSDVDPTGMGEPPFPPIFGAVANAMYRATGQRVYQQPFLGEKKVLG